MYSGRTFLTLLLLFSPIYSFASFPSSIEPQGEKQIIVNPRIHMWAAYNEDGKLVKSGLATSGSGYCPDLGRSCRTKRGRFRIESLGDPGCRSRKFPLPRGGAPMPYCMFFHNGQALHGSHEVVPRNVSHGCVRLHIKDARWIRYHFAEEPNSSNEDLGTVVIIKPY